MQTFAATMNDTEMVSCDILQHNENDGWNNYRRPTSFLKCTSLALYNRKRDITPTIEKETQINK